MENIFYREMIQEADDMEKKLVETRRDFHKYAEAGWFEFRTTSIIIKRLKELGYEVLAGKDVCLDESRMGLPPEEELEKQYQRALEQGAVKEYAEQSKGGFTGAIGILRCGEGPVIAMRFDIDALGVHENPEDTHRPSREGFASVNEGTMHACGHDGHTSIGLGVAEILMKHRDQLRGTIKLIFQPAEEGVRGAKSIVDYGHLDDVDFVLGNHMGNSGSSDYQVMLPAGGTLATSKLDVVFHGKAAHAGVVPELGNNAMLSAATAVLNIHAIPRTSQGITRINVGKLTAGSGRNVICDYAKLEVEVRGADTATNQYMEDYARRIIKAAAEMHGCSYEIKLMGAAETLKSDQSMLEKCYEVCTEKLGMKVEPPKDDCGASEDYAYMVNRVHSHGGKGVFFNTTTSCVGAFHSKDFDFQEDAMCNAVKVFCGMAYDLMQ